MNKPLILVVEDDPPVRNLITTTLKTNDYRYLVAANGEAAILEASSHNPDIVLLDLGLPDMDGVQVIQNIRSWSNLPIIVISARSEDNDKIEALDAGADDYLTKPFNILELKARIKALLRRAGSGNSISGNTLTIGDITLALDARNAYHSGHLSDLTAKEFDVIEFLMRNPNRVYSREALLDTIWAYEYRSDIRTVDVHIRRLREKLEENPAEPNYIMTKWGVGYYFRK